MDNLFTELTYKEFDWLGDFLLTRRGEDIPWEEGHDEGILDMSGLDRYFTALVGSVVVSP
jgi:hypothetical protein